MKFKGGSSKDFLLDWMDSNIGNIEFDGDGTDMSSGGSDGVGCEYLCGFSVVEFLFVAFVDALAFFMGLPLPPPSKEDFSLNLAAHCGIVSGMDFMLDIVSHFLIYYIF